MVERRALGDGIMAVFTSARQAIDAALKCGSAGDSAGLPLLLGVHTVAVLGTGISRIVKPRQYTSTSDG
ncbi:MAG: hypothetical protein IIC86_00470 [Chloroflexi bacterium]|nr:hypothetical protein [Chloroflexota bacterium]